MEWGPTKVKFIISKSSPPPTPPLSGMIQKISEGYKSSNHWQGPRMERGQVTEQPEGRQITNVLCCSYFLSFFPAVLHYYYYIIILFNFIRNNFFLPKWPSHFAFVPTMYVILSCSIFLSTLNIIILLNVCISNGCVVVCHYSFKTFANLLCNYFIVNYI